MKRSSFTKVCQAIHDLQKPIVADLHLHSTYSDGELTPAELVQLALLKGVEVISITDHDSIEGIRALQIAGQITGQMNAGVQIVAGVEISCYLEGESYHLLGYFFDPENDELQKTLMRLRKARWERGQAIIEALKSMKIELVLPTHWSEERISLGRPHLAKILLEQKVVRSIHEAFSRFFFRDPINRIPKAQITVEEAIGLLKQAKGLSSLAHPSKRMIESQLPRLSQMGLDAVEVWYPATTARGKESLLQQANDLGLALTGGSDLHQREKALETIGSCGLSRRYLDQLGIRSGSLYH